MPDREGEFAARMIADTPLMALLGTRVYKQTELLAEGLRGVAGVLDSGGYIQPCALIIAGTETPDGIVNDQEAQVYSTTQEVWINFYADKERATLLQAVGLTVELFYGWQPANAFPLDPPQLIRNDRDRGVLRGAPLVRQRWLVFSVIVQP